jgi:uncharacterized protein DUF4168
MAGRAVTTMATLAVLMAPVPLAVAQSGERIAQAAPSYGDAELKSFAGIVVEVQRIADSYEPKLKAAQTVREQRKVEEAASDEMTRAVTQEGLTVDRYQEILKRSLTDSEVADRIKRHIREAR